MNVVIENLTKVGNEVIEICHFIELNMTAIRKILKKFDKQFDKISL
jgi:SPX domain protein involved in polyphosphate accumulation